MKCLFGKSSMLVLLLTVCLFAVCSTSAQSAALFQESFESQSSVEANGGTIHGGTFAPGKDGNGYRSESAIDPNWGVPVADYITFPGSGRVNMTSGTADMYIYFDGSTLVSNSRVDLLDFLGTPQWNNRIMITLYSYNVATGQMILNIHTTSDPFLVGFPVDTNTGGSTLVSADAWHRVTATWSGLDGVSVPIVKCYFDGFEVASHTGAPGSILMVDTPPVFYIGTIYQGYTEPRPFVVFDELSVMDQPMSPIAVTGHVLAQSSSLPIRGAVVQLPNGGPTVVTGADGAYSMSLLPGDYTISASASGYIASEASVIVTDGVPVHQDITLSTEPIFDFAGDMSTTVNPSGLWSYGFKTSAMSGTLTSYTAFSNSMVAEPGTPAPIKNVSFEAPVTAGLSWGPVTDWSNDDRFGTGAPVGVMLASDQNRLPSGAPDGLQVAAVRECWFNQIVTRPDGTWIGSEPNKRFTLSAYLGIDTISPTQGLRPRTMTFGIYGLGANDWLVKQDLDLNSITPGTMQYVTMSFDTSPGSGIAEQGMIIGLYQTEANSLTLIDDVKFEIAPLVAQGISAWMKPDANNSGVGKNVTLSGVGGTDTWIEPGMAYMFPGEGGQYATARWTSPNAGSINISALFTGQSPVGTTSDVHVVRNGVSIYDGNVNGFNGTSPDYGDRFGATPSRAFSGQVTVAAGDTIDFCVGYDNGSYVNDATGISALIIPTTTQTGVVSGTVTASLPGNPAIANAIVKLVGTNRIVATAADGTYSMIVPAGSCQLTVSKDGYDSQTKSTTVPAGGSATLNFVLMQHIDIPASMAQVFACADSVNIDGYMSDWSESDFVLLDKVYDVTNSDPMWLNADIPEAYYAAKWDSDGGKLYVAIKVRDTSHHFTDEYTEWNVRDAVEMYIHTTGTGPFGYAESYNDAQHYVIGIKDSDNSQLWNAMAYHALPDAAGLQATGRVDGQWLYYEAAITPFQYFSMDGIGLIESPLSAGQIIGFDVVVAGCDSSGAYTGMKAANTTAPKWADYSKFAQHLLVTGYSSIGDVKNASIGTGIACTGIVSAAFDGFFYIESADRTSGIRVVKENHGLAAGQVATVSGYVYSLATGEKFILAATAAASGSGSVAPLGMTNKSLAGGGQGVLNGTGLNNIGLLIRTTGRVVDTSGQPSTFKIDDGSGVEVLVFGVVPSGADYVTVTGISSCAEIGSALVREILATEIDEISVSQ
ncbi:MAG: carboxypeptidase regulatory-like domain-containing protein [Armatimonadota bacterium]